MKDITLWKILAMGHLTDPELEAHLSELAVRPLDVRVPFFSYLLPCLEWEPASLRRAAVSCFAGGVGYGSWKILVEALNDPDEGVKEAAAIALSRSAVQAPERWIHVLFHPDPMVRLLGLRHRPEAISPMLIVQMLGDPENRESVLKLLLEISLPPQVIIPLLDFVDLGKIDREVAAAAIAGMAWDDDSKTILRVFRFPAVDPGYGDDGLKAATDWARYKWDGRRNWRRLVALFWDRSRENDPAANLFFARVWKALTGDRMGRRGQAFLSLAFMHFGLETGHWDDLKAAIAASAFPAILAHESIDPDIGRRAALLLKQGAGSIRRLDPLLDLSSTPLCVNDEGTINLAVVAGLLTLTSSGFYRPLFQHFSLGAVVASLLYSPRSGMAILSPRELTRKDTKARRGLVARLMEVVQPPPADIFAHLLLNLPVNELPDPGALTGCGEVFKGKLARYLLGPHRADLEQLSEDRQAAAGEWLAEQWSLQQFHLVVEALLTAHSLQELRFATALFGRAASRSVKHEFLTTVSALSEGDLDTFLQLVDWTPGFPYDKEWELARLLEKHPSPAAREWAEGKTARPPRTEQPQERESLRLTVLGSKQGAIIATCPDAHLTEALRPCYRRPTRGLCAALADREPSLGSALEVCAALVVTHDSPILASELFEVHCTSGECFLQELDQTLALRCREMQRLPLLGNAWLHRWDDHQDEFERQVEALDDGIARAARIGLALASPVLTVQLFQALLRLVQRFRWRHRGKLGRVFNKAAGLLLARSLYADYTVGPFSPAASDQFNGVRKPLALPDVQLLAARILIEVFRSGEAYDLMAELGGLLHANLSDVPEHCLGTLSQWVDTEGVAGASKTRFPDGPADEARLAAIRASEDLSRLLRDCGDGSSKVVEEAALRLLQIGSQGVQGLVDFILSRFEAPRYRILVQVIPLMDDDEGLQRLLDAVQAGKLPLEARFRVGLGLLEAGFATAKPVVFEAACEESEERWFDSSDWRLLGRAGLEEREIAVQLTVSPHSAAYSRAVALLVADTGPLRADLADALRRFLEISSNRARHIREEAARYLHVRGDLTGFSVLFSRFFRRHNVQEAHRLITPRAGGLVELFVRSCLAAVGDDSSQLLYLNAALYKLSPHSRVLAVHRAVVEWATSATLLFRASRALMERDVRAGKLSALASSLAWGTLVGKQLTGKSFSIDTAGAGELGHTRLTSRRISVSPLPVLRRERRGETVVRGLILHELGHHVYHADPKSLQLTAVAVDEKIGRLLNLVQDEHLERNLRARADEFGDAFKVLSAYAFQHRERPVAVATLVQGFGGRLFEVLSGTPLSVSRDEGCVVLNSGKVLLAMEATGLSFARFVRALRMGLGNRHGDPKVARALKLFSKEFRKHDAKGLLKVARELRRIFEDESEDLGLIGQDVAVETSPTEEAAGADGLTPEEVVEAARRILEGGRKDKGAGTDPGARAVRVINLGPEHDFPVIERVEKVPFDRAEYRQYALRTARSARRLRAYLANLGLAAIDEPHRVSGSRLDRLRLQAAVVRGDPRMLVGRRLSVSNDLFMGVLVDCSGSMTMNDNIETAKLFAVMLAEAVRGLSGIDARFFGFTDDEIFDAGDNRRCAVAGLESGGGNNDAAALWHAACAARASRRSAKLLVMISDGSPTACTVTALAGLVQRLTTRQKITCAQVAVHTLDEICFPHFVDLSGIDDDAAVAAFGRMVARLVGRTVKGG